MLHTNVSKTRIAFGQPVAEAKGHPAFYKVPKDPPQNAVIPLDRLVPGVSDQVSSAGKLVFHCVGDTGGINGEDMQKAISQEMESQFAAAPKLHHSASLNPQSRTAPSPLEGDPSFFYHLGDVVYFNGEEKLYGQQFYEPYQYYPGSILAIAGNHDGDNHPSKQDDPNNEDHETSLEGFFENFCDATPHYLSPYRPTMTQPYVYWTLDAPFATIIGLYSNVDGLLDPVGGFQQEAWYQSQLKNADPNKCLLVTVHHPPYSLDNFHGGYPHILAVLDDSAKAAGRQPNAIFTGHVHNYQRFTRTLDDGSEVPHIIAGAGGYANSTKATHKLQRDPAHNNAPITARFQTDVQGVALEAYNEVDGGFLRVTVDDAELKCEYFAVPFAGTVPATPFDTFSLDWKKRKITARSPNFAPDPGARVPTTAKRVGAGKIPHGWPQTGPSRSRREVR